jgi:hypothetical protein
MNSCLPPYLVEIRNLDEYLPLHDCLGIRQFPIREMVKKRFSIFFPPSSLKNNELRNVVTGTKEEHWHPYHFGTHHFLCKKVVCNDFDTKAFRSFGASRSLGVSSWDREIRWRFCSAVLVNFVDWDHWVRLQRSSQHTHSRILAQCLSNLLCCTVQAASHSGPLSFGKRPQRNLIGQGWAGWASKHSAPGCLKATHGPP